MRLVLGKPLNYYLKGQPLSPATPLFRERYTHRGSLIVLCLVLLLISGIEHRGSMVLGVSLCAYLAMLFFRLRQQAQGLKIEHFEPPSHGREEQELKVQIKITNSSPTPLDYYFIEDVFEPAMNPNITLSAGKINIPARSTRMISYSRVCDGGMGEHLLGPVFIQIKDPLGIFDYRVYNLEQHKIIVFPKIQPIPSPESIGNPLTPPVGGLNVFDREQSVDFFGVRQFFPGDPIKQIAWRISAKSENLHVKEFEKTVSTISYVALDMNPLHHMGIKALSTWEIMRDTALSLIKTFASEGHQVALLSQGIFLEPKKNTSLVELYGSQLIRLNPHKELQSNIDDVEFSSGAYIHEHRSELLYEMCKTQIHRRSQLVYICSYCKDDLDRQIDFFRYMQTKDVRITVFYIDLLPIIKKLKDTTGAYHSLLGEKFTINQEELSQTMIRNEISAYIIDLDLPFWSTFSASANSDWAGDGVKA